MNQLGLDENFDNLHQSLCVVEDTPSDELVSRLEEADIDQVPGPKLHTRLFRVWAAPDFGRYNDVTLSMQRSTIDGEDPALEDGIFIIADLLTDLVDTTLAHVRTHGADLDLICRLLRGESLGWNRTLWHDNAQLHGHGGLLRTDPDAGKAGMSEANVAVGGDGIQDGDQYSCKQ